MSFALFVIYLILTFVRPGEHIPALREWAVMDVVSGLALAAAGISVLTGAGSSFRAVQVPLVVAFWAWTLVSVVASPVRSDTAMEDVLGFAKSSGTAFLLVVLNVVTIRRVRAVAVVLTFCAVFVVGQAVSGLQFGVGPGQPLATSSNTQDARAGWEAQPEHLGEEARGGTADDAARMSGVGMFGDPNDLANTLVAILPFTLALRRTSAPLRNALLVWVPVGLIVYAIYLTHSRGGVIALACVLALSVRHRIGSLMTVVLGAGVLGSLLALGFLGGRSMTVDESAMGRIEAWSQGLQMLKSSPVWGVGLGMFTLYNEKVAHNSFVHCVAELGLVGYCLWLSLIMLTLDDMQAVIRAHEDGATDLRQWARALSLSIIGFLIGGLFLSRSYDVALFILLGIGTAVAGVARRRGLLLRARSAVQWTYQVIAVALASITLFWLYMRLLR